MSSGETQRSQEITEVQIGRACLTKVGVLGIHISTPKVIYLTLHRACSTRNESTEGKTTQWQLDRLLWNEYGTDVVPTG